MMGGVLKKCSIEHETEFGGAFIKISIDDFNALGFEYGDSVDVLFSNGFRCENIPYYDGYYADNGELALVSYPGNAYVKASVCFGDDLWERARLTDEMTADITVIERGAYIEIQKARSIHYNDDRSKYASDEIFANFRSIEVSTIKEKTVYRSASPCDNQHSRAAYADRLSEKAGIRCVLDLADDDAKIAGYMSEDEYDSPYFKRLYGSGSVIPIGLTANYESPGYRSKLAAGLSEMAEREGPFLIQCTEGKDRTGFVCMLLEALTGAGWDEIERDYMITYDNYYGITRGHEKYDIIVKSVLEIMVQCITGAGPVDVRHADLSGHARRVLLDAGMDDETIDKLKARISRQDEEARERK